jgi:hypothetical protein
MFFGLFIFTGSFNAYEGENASSKASHKLRLIHGRKLKTLNM